MRNCSFEEHFNKYNYILIAILKSNHFFQPNTSLDKFKVINDHEKADTLYTMEYPLEELGEEEGKNYDIYVDLMNDRTVMSLFKFADFAEFGNEEYENFYNLLGIFDKTVWEILDQIQLSNHNVTYRFTDYIFNDFTAFSAYLTFCSIPDKLMELKLEAYINGAMPCGWYGKYPEGKLAVYVPLAE